jgi:transposase
MVRENDGRKLDHHTLEQVRLRTVEQIRAGTSPEVIARALGFNRTTIYNWLAAFREGGVDALKAKPVPGRPRKLQGRQLARLYRMVAGKDPRQLQFPFGLWTRAMVRELIKREFGVALSEVSVGRLLRTMGLSPQRPVYRAYQQDAELVRQWREVEYPKIRAEAHKIGAEIYFADEAAVRSDHHAGTSWAPVGKTPVVTSTGARFSLNLMSAVSPKGLVRFRILPARLTAPVFVDFCRRLLHDVGRPVFLIVDSHAVHRSKAVARYVESTKGKLRLFFLPPYSPQLNPDEWVWRNVKGHRLGRSQFAGPDDLRRKALSALRRLQRLPAVVRGFFHDPDLRYILE